MKNVIEPQVIINTVCDVCEVKLSDVASKKRNRKYDISRQLIYFLLQTNTNLTYEDIGHMVGGRDVFTVMFGLRKILERKEQDRYVNELINNIDMKIKQEAVTIWKSQKNSKKSS